MSTKKQKTKAVKTAPVGAEAIAPEAEPNMAEVMEAEETPPLEVEGVPNKPAVVEPKTTAVATKPEVDEDLKERLEEARESFDTFDDIKLPIVRLTNDGFEVTEGAEPILEFTGTIVYTKQSNVYFKSKYKPGVVTLPDCASSDGRTPDASIEEPVSPSCKGCKFNEFGSASDDEDENGKACKNTRPTFILIDNPDADGLATMPKVLRVSPTSLALIRNYITNVAADFGAYYAVKSKFQCFKKDEEQPYYNVKFTVVRKLDLQEKVNVKEVRKLWLTFMQQGFFGTDDIDVTPEASEAKDVSPKSETEGDVDF